ncbi:PAS domain-containing hybrid sensor histidine kinase/response regulator [Candidatus Contubernalis alkaliaceticus]|uniref:PAS domain-containing hybrid sensor histidine kinase/response regulator n=1 Tax=Candidatus Contubernalis alkaliaceticus TaxID=338645 RepID=UPI001F4C0F75|nr:PAS domain S-box protein [Candidatus Contubernalis alkalaceticus]UNC91464.1 PAS domain S-box protein [Candidatus Contubernalis alkalaceticus]
MKIETQRKSAEDRLNQLVEEKELLLDNIELQVWYLTDIETYGAVNNTHAKFFGVKKRDLENKTLWEILSSEEEARICIEGNKWVFQEKKKLKKEEWVVDGKGKPRLLAITKTPKLNSAGSVEYVVCSALDITDQRRIEEEIENTIIFFENIVNTASDPIFVKDSKYRFKLTNEALCNFLGYSREEMLGKTDYDFFSKEQADVFRGNDIFVFSTGLDNMNEEIITDLSGKQHIVSTKKSVFTIPNTSEKYLVGVIHDITERKRVERALQESERHYRQIVDLFPIAIFGHSEKEILFANTAAAKLVDETDPKFLNGKSLLEFLHPEDREPFMKGVKEVIEKRNTKIVLTAKLIIPTGRVINTELVLSNFVYQEKYAVQIVGSDITKRKKIEEEIFKADKLESIGILAGGIAHDFNNYLATLLGNISLAMSYKEGNYKKIYEKLENMKKATLRAKDLSHQLFVFAKGVKPVKTIMPIRDLIIDITQFTLSGSNVCYRFFIEKDLYLVEIDEGQITQVLHNLIINAVQAMPTEGGKIQIRAENIFIEGEKDEALITLSDDNYIKISIEDNGPGISVQNVKKIFDPFFSTKIKGSGLGLATSYSIIKNHDGCIVVESEVGKGSTFNIYLPAVTKHEMKKNESDEVIYGQGKILVVDDEDDVRNTIGEMLSWLNYQVYYAKDGVEAINIYIEEKNKSQPFDLIVMDLTIPGGMGGKKTIKKLKQLDPEVKAIVSSGYSEDPVMSSYKDYGFKGVIKKPFRIEELSVVIHETIQGS